MKVSVPSSLEIGGATYAIRVEDELELLRNNHVGETRHLELEIVLSTEGAPDRRSHTFLHECLHAIDEEYCDSKAMTEDGTDAVASGLLQVLKQLGIELVLEDTHAVPRGRKERGTSCQRKVERQAAV